eukprot:2557209-Prymnesium_polylepis.2
MSALNLPAAATSARRALSKCAWYAHGVEFKSGEANGRRPIDCLYSPPCKSAPGYSCQSNLGSSASAQRQTDRRRTARAQTHPASTPGPRGKGGIPYRIRGSSPSRISPRHTRWASSRQPCNRIQGRSLCTPLHPRSLDTCPARSVRMPTGGWPHRMSLRYN